MNVSMHLSANLGAIPGFNELLHNNENVLKVNNILKLSKIESKTN